MLITGAAGFIGSRLATLALARGYSVRTLTRSDWTGPPRVMVDQRFFGTLPEQIPLEALQVVDVVVHCAANTEDAERIAHAVNVEGTVRLAQLARQTGVQTFIFLSSQSARPDALSAYGRTKYAAERALMDQDGLNVIVLRPGLVTGPGSRGLYRRLVRTVESLPVIPLLGGGRQIVQPIHVDDLCTAIFRCDELASSLHKRTLNVGATQGVPLVEFLQTIALGRFGRRKLTLAIPFRLVEITVDLANALRIRLPFNRNNVRGLKTAQRMETEADLARLGLILRPLDQMVRDDPESGQEPSSLLERPVRVLLIGAGRIGLVHAITLSRLHGVALCGVVDPKAGARTFLLGLGLSAPTYRTLDEAFAQAKPDVAVIATPGNTHLSLTRACMARGLAVMVEKPLATRQEQLAGYERLAHEFPRSPVLAGYVMLRNPQIAYCLDLLRAGRLGEVRGFVGVTLLSFIQETATNRWEVNRNLSGGGVLINAGAHVLSMIRAAFGDPQSAYAESLKAYSTEVEDSMVLTLTYPGFSGKHYCSWSIGGYPRQENKLTIRTDRGWLILTGSVAVFVRNDGEIDLTHQLDFRLGFNIAPDYAGAGFTTELTDLIKMVRKRQPPPLDLMEAIELERLLFKLYHVAEEVKTFSDGRAADEPLPSVGLRLSGTAPGGEDTASVARRVLDVRDLSTERVHDYLRGAAGGPQWDGYLLAPAQMRGLPASWQTSERLRVTVPDFLNQSRLLSAGRHGEVLKQMGARGLMGGLRVAVPRLLSERAPTFWVVAMGLLGAGLQDVPAGFQGTLLLHTYLTDLALSLRRLDMLEKMLRTCRRMRPRARVGFHTNMAAEAMNALRLLDVSVDDVSVLTSPKAVDMGAIFSAIRAAPGQRGQRLTAEVGLAPAVVHRVAFDAPQRWMFGADAILLGIGADPALAMQRQMDIEREWAKVYPGLSLPEGVL